MHPFVKIEPFFENASAFEPMHLLLHPLGFCVLFTNHSQYKQIRTFTHRAKGSDLFFLL